MGDVGAMGCLLRINCVLTVSKVPAYCLLLEVRRHTWLAGHPRGGQCQALVR